MEVHRHHLGWLPLEQGGSLPSVVLEYATWGKLNSAGTNAVLLPTYFTGSHSSYSPWIGAGRALDPSRWFIVSVNMLGNGRSSSPSESSLPDFPVTTVLDNVRAQARLLDSLGIRSLALVAGWSMGAMQALRWASEQPLPVQAVFSLCGTLSCGPNNEVFLEGLLDILAARTGDRDPNALRAFGSVYAGWAYSNSLFAGRGLSDLGHSGVMSLVSAWRADHAELHAGDLEAMARTWRWSYATYTPQRIRSLLRRVTGETVIMPGSSDAYFTASQASEEASWIPRAKVQVLESNLGHMAGKPGIRNDESQEVDAAMSALLSRSSCPGR